MRRISQRGMVSPLRVCGSGSSMRSRCIRRRRAARRTLRSGGGAWPHRIDPAFDVQEAIRINAELMVISYETYVDDLGAAGDVNAVCDLAYLSPDLRAELQGFPVSGQAAAAHSVLREVARRVKRGQPCGEFLGFLDVIQCLPVLPGAVPGEPVRVPEGP